MALLLTCLILPSGCLHLGRELPPAPGWDLPVVLPPARPAHPAAPDYMTLAAGVLVLAGLAYGLSRWRRAWRQAGQGVPLDREDLALLRTARDAIGFLAQKQVGRLKVVSLARRRRGRGP